MISAYQDIISYADEDDFFEGHLKKMHILDIFKGLLDEFTEPDIFRGVVWFIVWGYSIQSDMLQTSGLTWEKLSKKIFDKTGLPTSHFSRVAGLESESVRDSIDRWLMLSNDENWTQYITYRDLRRQFLSASLMPLPKTKFKTPDKTMKEEDGGLEMEVDMAKLKSMVESKMLCATNSEQLLKMMESAKERFIQTQPRLKLSVSELNKVNHSKSTRTTEEIFT